MISRLARWWLADDLMVRSAKRPRRLYVWVTGTLLLGFGCTAALALIPYGNPLRVIPSSLMGMYVAAGCLVTFKRMEAFRRGWAYGRIEMLDSLREAQRRGMSLSDWVELEYERTGKVLGVKPPEERTGGWREALRDRAGKLRGWCGSGVRRAWRWLARLGGKSRAGSPADVGARRDGSEDERGHAPDGQHADGDSGGHPDAGHAARPDGEGGNGV